MIRFSITAVLISALAAGGAAAEDIFILEDSFSAVLEAGSNVIISNINGDITIEEWDSDQVLIQYSIQSDSPLDMESIFIECTYIDGIICEVAYPGEYGNIVVDFHVNLPELLDLNLIMFTLTGCISINSGTGTSLVEIMNGSAVLEGFEGELTVNVVSGEIDLQNVPGLAAANVVEGVIRGTLSEIERDIEISTVSGLIDLVLECSPAVTVSTMSGDIDIPGIHVLHDLIGSSAEFGDGEFKIDITTVSGNVRIRK